ncbi:MAG: ligase [Burkholderiaceae bacterium]
MPVLTDAAGEQRWNAAALAERPVRAQARVWRWPQPAIVLGCGQRRLLPDVQQRLATLPGSPVEVLVREAGGGAVLVGPWLIGVSLLLPTVDPRAGRSPTDGYRWLALRLVEALRAAGCPARTLPPAVLAGHQDDASLSWACYGGLSAWEIVDEAGRKLVGLAQRRTRDAVLVVAGVLATPPDWPLLSAALGRPDDAARLAGNTSACLPAGADIGPLAEAIEAAVDPAQAELVAGPATGRADGAATLGA